MVGAGFGTEYELWITMWLWVTVNERDNSAALAKVRELTAQARLSHRLNYRVFSLYCNLNNGCIWKCCWHQHKHTNELHFTFIYSEEHTVKLHGRCWKYPPSSPRRTFTVFTVFHATLRTFSGLWLEAVYSVLCFIRWSKRCWLFE
jgi:hypothetical protein